MSNTIEEVRVAGAIHLYKNALSDELCDGIWDFYYSNIDSATHGRTSGGLMPQTKRTLDFSSNANTFSGEKREKYMEFDVQIYQSLKRATEMYVDRFNTIKECPDLRDTGYLWQGYKKGEGYYKEHIDGDQWSSSVSNRVMAVIIYINTVEQGGETYFRLQDVAIKPEKGTVCIFPAHWEYPHQAMVPLSSDKLIISSFVVSFTN